MRPFTASIPCCTRSFLLYQTCNVLYVKRDDHMLVLDCHLICIHLICIDMLEYIPFKDSGNSYGIIFVTHNISRCLWAPLFVIFDEDCPLSPSCSNSFSFLISSGVNTMSPSNKCGTKLQIKEYY